jgi:hypothetical protein
MRGLHRRGVSALVDRHVAAYRERDFRSAVAISDPDAGYGTPRGTPSPRVCDI